MFIQVIVLAIILGLVFKGNLKNLSNLKFEGIYYLVAAFLLEAAVIISIRKGLLTLGTLTTLSDILMYTLLLIFIIKNMKDPLIVMVGIGFMLNAIPIFANGGMMPVTINAVHAAGLTDKVGTMGLYHLVDSGTRFWFLGDIIPYTFINKNIISIGDLVLSLGIMFIIIRGMKREIKACPGKCTRVCRRTCVKNWD